MTARKPLIAGNWKMFKTGGEAVETAENLVQRVRGVDRAEVMIAPPFTALAQVSAVVQGTDVALGAQNLHWEAEGAFTGEISAAMLCAAGCTYVIIGHSERRQFFGETDETVNRKIRATLAAGLSPVFCIGETEAQREAGDVTAAKRTVLRALEIAPNYDEALELLLKLRLGGDDEGVAPRRDAGAASATGGFRP